MVDEDFYNALESEEDIAEESKEEFFDEVHDEDYTGSVDDGYDPDSPW